MNDDILMLWTAIFGLVITIAFILYTVGYFGGNQAERNEENAEEDDMEEDQRFDENGRPIPATRRALRREQKRQEREQIRKFEEYRREEARKQQEAVDLARRKRLLEEENAENAKEQAARKAEEELALQAEEELKKWKGKFVVEKIGCSDDNDEHLLQELLEYIQERKVVVIEDLAVAFGLTTQDAIHRIESLLHANRLSGILDDRGKFIVISDQDMNNVAAYIERRGRVNLRDLTRECNRLIELRKE